jgi:uncharacterized protein with HEPN domain
LKDEDRDWFHLRQTLRFIAHIDRRLSLIDEAAFHADRDEVDLTAYRFQMIGEAARRLSASLNARHPDIPWAGIIGMRNIIAHDYEGIASAVMWNTGMSLRSWQRWRGTSLVRWAKTSHTTEHLAAGSALIRRLLIR